MSLLCCTFLFCRSARHLTYAIAIVDVCVTCSLKSSF
ncbi:hypothetical protein GLYMA_03G041850v4 [Glycine max]|nr:hypothetical protein GLYMA_03G041850v4 [Glycine max]KAH1068553.1 hypothetical protein GYH30_006216 [Glycine max]